MKHPYPVFGKKSLRSATIVISSVTVAFLIGIQTAGEYQPIASLQADGTTTAGDFNSNGHLDIQDARIALELASGYRSPTPDELAADPNRDFDITIDDVLAILDILERAPSTPKVNL